jgi:hypothetical protein
MKNFSLKSFFASSTFRLVFIYVALIMAMSMSFSVIFFATSSHELGRQLPPDSLFQGILVSYAVFPSAIFLRGLP